LTAEAAGSAPASGRVLRLGVIGLGRAFTLMLSTFTDDRRVELVAAADPREEVRRRFNSDFGGPAYHTVEALCGDPAVEAVYVASPHQFHAQQVAIAAASGKHVLVEKPMAITLADCQAMIEATRAGGVKLLVGHSHSFNAPILHARKIIDGGTVGRVRMITAFNFTDFMYRPRRPEELDTASGGGVLFSQAAHQIDIVRLLGGGRVRSVRAATGAWDPTRPSEGAYTALLTFEDGTFASVVYSGYGHFDSDEFCGWTGEMGQTKDPAVYGSARRMLQELPSAAAETALKNSRTYGGEGYRAPEAPEHPLHQHFGPLIVSCERADLRPLPRGVMIYGDEAQRLDPLPAPAVPRSEVIDELYEAVVLDRAPLHSGEWALATTEVCLAMLRSARDQGEVTLKHQVGLPGHAKPS
jgi:phthalate 4,5-cis-dihydrodiol dehydrogenase